MIPYTGMHREGREIGGDEEDQAAFDREAYLSPFFKVRPPRVN